MKRIFGILVTIAILCAAFSVVSFAAEPSYGPVTVNITLNEDGTTQVVETWNITYFSSDSVKTFSRSIDKKSSNTSLTELEEVESISVVGVIFDGEAISSESDQDNYYTFSETSDAYIITLTATTDEDSISVVISYIVNGAIKEVSNTAQFNFCLFGSTTGTVNKATVTVTAPGEISSINNLIDYISESQSNSVTYYNKMVTGNFIISLTMDEDDFTSLADYSSFGASLRSFFSTLKTVLPYIIYVLVLIAIIVLSYISLTRRKVHQIRKTKEYKKAKPCIPTGVTLPEAALMVIVPTSSNKRCLTNSASGIFALGIAQLIKSGYIVYDGNNTILVPKDTNALPEYEKCIFELLNNYASRVNEQVLLDSDFFAKIIEDIKRCPDYFFNLVRNYISMIPAPTSKKLKDKDYVAAFSSVNQLAKDAPKAYNFDTVITSLLNGTADDATLLAVGTIKANDEFFVPGISSLGNDSFGNSLAAVVVEINRIFNDTPYSYEKIEKQ